MSHGQTLIFFQHLVLPGRWGLEVYREYSSLHSQEIYNPRGEKKPTITVGYIHSTFRWYYTLNKEGRVCHLLILVKTHEVSVTTFASKLEQETQQGFRRVT